MAILLKPADSLPASIASSPARPAPWVAAWARPGFRLRLGAVLFLLLGLLPVVPGFYHFIQARPGHLLADPLLALLPVHDVSAPTFALIYGAIAATLLYLLPRPQRLLRALWAYYFLQLLRMLTLWLLPLEPPTALVILHDPVMDRIFEVTTQPIVRDLFFSGHTATMVLLTLAGRGRKWRWALGLMSVAVGLLVLVQRVHYSYDVLAAPLFAWLAYWLAGRITKQQPAIHESTLV
ncbi:phosphatase PAP2-related protein [Hymenobacter convexus]|uniref:phosphatase PAP2-related protein n=1 Tax=Hymenobacter sp. CA1UV-4 TaxID=3063782 RepID=UPI00271244F6|nr:phosphatase PAP2-related protein [Hymenobacter sp. CA1UV-4]MDO7850359.1 phosphatase PAP2-related protein [Hymenobacter sp. CA1UV-4]